MPPFLTFLDADALTAQGLDPAWRFGMADRVRFSEIDALDHVNHTVPLRWFESLRMHYLRHYGIAGYDGSGAQVVLKAVEVQYDAPLYVGEEYIVATRTASFRHTSFRMDYGVFAPELRVTGAAIVVLTDPETGAKTPLSSEARALLARRDGAIDAR